jgi:hypothetical protein
MISFKSERTRHRIGCGEGVYRVGMGAGGQWAAGEGVADGAHGFRVVKICCVNFCSCGEHDRKEKMTEMSVGYLCVCTPIP